MLVERSVCDNRRRGYTLIELLTVAGIVSILLSLLLPAVQNARESGRRVTCSNNCRQIVIATLNFEAQHREFPSTYFAERPGGQSYDGDRGLLMSIMPFLDESIRMLDRKQNTFHAANQPLFKFSPSVLLCPSNSEAAILTGLPPYFSSSNSQNALTTQASDYAVCGGAVPLPNSRSYAQCIGIAGLSIAPIIRAPRAAQVLDGLSATVGGWESRGDKLYGSTGKQYDMDASAAPTTTLYLSKEDSIRSLGSGTTKSWFHSWAGHRVGALLPFDNDGALSDWEQSTKTSRRVINITNFSNAPMSAHSIGVQAWKLDGSVDFISRDVDSNVMKNLATIAGGEHE